MRMYWQDLYSSTRRQRHQSTMNRFYAYTRVSTQRQGEKGVSLQEQHTAIARYAERHNLQIAEWLEERVTAAKKGRPLFDRMLKGLRAGEAQGVIIHKIDRSARNLRDWSDLGELIDSGISVHFANESIDLQSRGGRLSADIQAVVASDYIRNLREETIKGMRGRLKQGFYPWGAPVGYLNTGGGQAKAIDPVRGPLVRQAFELYASGRFSLDSLAKELDRRGLRKSNGRPMTANGLSWMLNNPFYIGLMKVKTTGETYEGKHAPLVSTNLFRQVKDRLSGKYQTQTIAHDFLFRGLFRCQLCQRSLVGELQKGKVYYRCHTKGCATKSIREEVLEAVVLASWPTLKLTKKRRASLQRAIEHATQNEANSNENRKQNVEAQLAATNDRLARLIDAFVDGVVEKDAFELRKRSLLEDRMNLEGQLRVEPVDSSKARDHLTRMFELVCVAQQSYRLASKANRRQLVLLLSSNRTVSGKYVRVEPYFPLVEDVKALVVQCGGPIRCTARTTELTRELLQWARED